MSQDNLGLFDTPPDRRHVWFAAAAAGLLVAAVLLLLPVREVRWPEVPAFIPMIDAVMLLGDMITAALLFAEAAVFRSRALTVLAAAYVFMGLLLIPHALTFPGAFAPDGLLGAGLNTTAWIGYARRIALPLAVLVYVQLRRVDSAVEPGSERPGPGIALGAWAAIGLAAAVTVLATAGHALLPPSYLSRSHVNYPVAVAYESVFFAFCVVAAGRLLRSRRSALDLWLLVVLTSWLAQSLIILTLHARFTIGWYGLFAMVLVSHLVVMVALLAESNRLYIRLALSTSARNREREARLMSIDAVAVAIAHDIGPPLTAVSLHAKSGLNRLTRDPPDVDRAIGSLRATIEAAHSATEVVGAIRAMIAARTDATTELSLNDLVRETSAQLDRELAGEKVSLRLSLDPALPPVLADRAQMQRVLLNLFTNAIESLRATKGRPRRLAVRSAPLDEDEVLLEVTDNGVGLPPGGAEHIFEAFHTTKTKGAGVGLSLCRTIVGAHGGRLWASPGVEHGATFHLQLPRSDLAGRLELQG